MQPPPDEVELKAQNLYEAQAPESGNVQIPWPDWPLKGHWRQRAEAGE